MNSYECGSLDRTGTIGLTAFFKKAEKSISAFVHFCNSYSYIWFIQFVC